ncbi:heme iron utilization protein [Anoxybacillus gonensis]|uniref:Heme iron utilization protein n=2 Tax=Anoxybacillus TaxID=150247 RepID=A0A2G5RSS3_9BACL|nr:MULTISPECIES: pyridoxamine 5'-phosphate oxidase family protein [Anoxybacillus]AKS39429.1 heme iron utilization protein [Anoxybacillus gonensis]KFZ42795.1 heme iron utilization protein [Anoxybacillus sp. KU2-6(11)]KGP60683.1 heme iron utilization protein [Anoxybacillus gonensis]MDO0877888.1 pyridoxamine 5'-phosphate oxidase family protein [Anoxybacillus gonensis]PIC05753.1 heme iron utilization protein [Anoxybacillus flavithermus]
MEEKKRERYVQFVKQCKTMMISTIDERGEPFISYAPFVIDESHFYIFISRTAEHFQYIERNERVSVLLIADEATSTNLFARERVRFTCKRTHIGNNGNDHIFAKFEDIHGKPMIRLLRSIDFSLFQLTPMEGRYVVGFGQAFDVDLNGERFTHVIVNKNEEGRLEGQ